MEHVNFDDAAEVHWRPSSSDEDTSRRFDSVRSAIQFVMHDLESSVRAAAWVSTSAGNLSYSEIETLHRRAGA